MQQTTYPLTSAQMGMYYEWQKDKELTQYNNPFLYRFPDQIDAERLKAAFVKVIEAHPFLKLKLKILGNVYIFIRRLPASLHFWIYTILSMMGARALFFTGTW